MKLVSDLMREICRILSLHQLATTPYHLLANSLVEEFNGTLKTMLRRMCAERPNDRDRYLAPLLFEYREVPQASLGFSPFELVYGRHVKGLLTILKELQEKEKIDPELKSTYQYVFELRNRLEETFKIAHEELERTAEKYAHYYNAGQRERSMKPGDKVLLLIPTEANKLTMPWKGPFTVVEKRGVVDYLVDLGSSRKLFHINLLKKYEPREEETEGSQALEASTVIEIRSDDTEIDLPDLRYVQKEGPKHLHVSRSLSVEESREIHSITDSYPEMFYDTPG